MHSSPNTDRFARHLAIRQYREKNRPGFPFISQERARAYHKGAHGHKASQVNARHENRSARRRQARIDMAEMEFDV